MLKYKLVTHWQGKREPLARKEGTIGKKEGTTGKERGKDSFSAYSNGIWNWLACTALSIVQGQVRSGRIM